MLRAERDVVADRFRGSRSAYALGARGGARDGPALARLLLADELRRRAVEAGLRVPAPSDRQARAWFDTYAGTIARAVRADRPASWLGDRRTGVALARDAPARVFALRPGASASIRGIRVTALGEPAPLGSFPFAQAQVAVRRALLTEARDAAFATWSRRRQNQALPRLTCRRDEAPQPATVDLTSYAPFLSL